jgi:hypothetical protein
MVPMVLLPKKIAPYDMTLYSHSTVDGGFDVIS